MTEQVAMTRLTAGKIITAVFFLVSIVAITFFLYTTTARQHTPTEPYNQARLVFDTQDIAEQKRYAVREDTGKFLFASGAPRSIGPALFFHQTGKIKVQVQGIYPSGQCSDKGTGKATIIFATRVERLVYNLENGIRTLTLPIVAGDRLPVLVKNTVEQECGRAMIWLSQDTHLLRHITAFVVIWVGLLLLLTRFGLGFMAVWGAGIQASITLSETLYLQPISNHIGLSALVALAGVGLVLAPMCIRILRPVALSLFIVVTIVLYGIPLLNIGNYWAFNNPLDSDSIHAILQSNPSEAFQFLGDNYSAVRLTVVGLLLIGMIWVAGYSLRKSVSSLAISGLGLFLVAMMVNFSPQVNVGIVTLKIWKNSSYSYFRELAAYQKLAEQRANITKSYQITRAGPPKTTVLIIGESHNKNHMSIYGYPRLTTPLLERQKRLGNLIVLQNAYSNHTHTTPTLSLALTEANQYGSKSWAESPSIIELAKQAKLGTYWISNQQMLGAWDNKVALIAKEAEQIVAKNKKIGLYKQPVNYDEVLIEPLQISMQDEGEKLIVMHLMGSHASYCLRYPESNSIFHGELDPGIFGKLKKVTDTDRVNCYDNSIAYNDQVLDQIFQTLEKSGEAASVFYFADHSEDVFSGVGHNQAKFNFSMIEVPAFFWVTERWKTENAKKWQQIKRNRAKLFTNDLVFETVAGLMGLQEKSIDTTKDFSHVSYAMPNHPKTLHGRMNIDARKNHRYWQSKNAAIVSRQGLGGRLLPHRVNSFGKLLDISWAGIKSFEVDIYFRSEGDKHYFEVGHDRTAMSGIQLIEFLAKAPGGFEKIWLDLKNANPGNIEEIANRLNFLDAAYHIKNRIIVETSSSTTAPVRLAEQGFHVSYYLPTGKVLAVQDKDERAKRDLAISLSDIAKSQQAGAVSFDLRLYDYVKSYLEPLLTEEIQYHTWFPGVDFKDNELLPKLGDRKFYVDQKVKTILLPYSSSYSL